MESELPSLSSKEDVIKALQNLIVVISEKEMDIKNNIGSIKDAYGNSVGVWLLTK
jgi:hypothetical protein